MMRLAKTGQPLSLRTSISERPSIPKFSHQRPRVLEIAGRTRRFGPLLLHTLPTVITHNFHPDRGALQNICYLPNENAERIVASIRLGGHAYLKRNYLARRLRTEDWLVAERIRKIGETPLARPIYFFLGNMTDGWDKSRPASIVLPLAMFDVDTITFTFPDSMESCPQVNSGDHSGGPWHGQVFTFAEVTEMVARHGFPDPTLPRERRGPNAFIEVQIWDDRPLLEMRRHYAL